MSFNDIKEKSELNEEDKAWSCQMAGRESRLIDGGRRDGHFHRAATGCVVHTFYTAVTSA